MEKLDARRFNQETQYQLRRQVVRLRERGMKYKEIAEIVGITYNHARTIYKRYERGGLQAIAKRKRGRRLGEHRTLSAGQEAAIQGMIQDKTPDSYGMPYALWNREAIQQLIKRQYGIKMPIRTVGDYLRRWGFTPQKPLKRAYEQDPGAVQRWLDHDYPKIAARAKAEGASMHWCDETGLRSDENRRRGYAPRGKTPVVHINVNRKSVSMISAITNQGKVRFMVLESGITVPLLITFLEQLLKDVEQKVFVILDNLRAHHSKEVREWAEKHNKRIALFYLPPYSPELNPDEYLNGDMKAAVLSGTPARSKRELKRKVLSHMRKLQKLPGRVQKYFDHPCIKYAA
ncbi:MAG: IS630 family transposase [Nitrospirota bacterium]